ncbi:MAG: hypothetical protein QOH15_1626 [Gaiellales bacterium]|nr:hypothetical protein [Gaiellales bacterium]
MVGDLAFCRRRHGPLRSPVYDRQVVEQAPSSEGEAIASVGRRWVRRPPSWTFPIAIAWLAAHVVVVVAVAIAVSTANTITRHGLANPDRKLPLHTLDQLTTWDGDWFIRVAQHGYSRPNSALVALLHTHAHAYRPVFHAQIDAPFFPLLPALIRVAHEVGFGWRIGALLVANLASLAGVLALGALGVSLFGEEIGARAAVYLAISPMAFVLAMVYSEGVALLCVCAAGAFLARDRHGWAAAFALLAALARPQGVLVVIPLLWMAWRRGDAWSRRALLVAAPLLGLGAMLVLQHIQTGDALLFAHAERAWGRPSPSLDGLVHSWHRWVHIVSAPNSLPYDWRDAVAVVVALGLLVVAALQRLPAEWIVFGGLNLLAPLATGDVTAVARYSLLSLPIFWALARLGRNHAFDSSYRIIAPGLMGVLAALMPYSFP